MAALSRHLAAMMAGVALLTLHMKMVGAVRLWDLMKLRQENLNKTQESCRFLSES
jgi:hypothetical protein